MSYTNKGFTGNDGSETSGWDPLEVQHFQDIENCAVGDAIGGVKDTAGHKHGKMYDNDKNQILSVINDGVNVGVSVFGGYFVSTPPGYQPKVLKFNGDTGEIIQSELFEDQKIDTGTTSTDSFDATSYNSYSWRPAGSGTTARTLTITNPQEGEVIRIVNGATNANLASPAGLLTPGTVIFITYDNGFWYKIGAVGDNPKINTSVSGTDTVDCSYYNRFSWRPSNSTGSGTLTVTLTNPIEGRLLYVNSYANTWSLIIGGHTISDCPGPVQAIMMYDNGSWRMMSVMHEG
jgi:hypothetical protein